MTKLLITGANGLLGQALVRRFSKTCHVIGCDLSDEYFDPDEPVHEYLRLDLTRRNDVLRHFSVLRPEIVINAAAYTDVDKSETDREKAWNINVKTLEILEEGCKSFRPLFIHISTDYVFDGNSGPYRESDPTKALGFYGMTKLAAEKIVRQGELEYIIARTMVLYGTGKKVRPNFATWVIDQLQNNKQINVVDDQIGNPTLVDDLAEGIFRLIEKEEYGLFHIAGNQVVSRYDFAMEIAKVFNLDASLINRTNSSEFKQQAPRPVNSAFVLDKLNNAIDWLPGNLNEALMKLKKQMGI